MEAQKLNPKRVLVTGGGGFLGRYIVAELRGRGYGKVLAPRSRDYDLRDFSAVKRLFAQYEPEIVIHCAAAVGGIGANQREPGRFFYDNAAMALHLIEASRMHSAKRFVGIGTTCSYPRDAQLPLREADLYSGSPDWANAPYGHAKRLMHAQLEAYGRQYGLNSLMVIPANLYGPYDHFELESSHVIPGMIRRFEDARAEARDFVTLWGDGTPTRDFLHVQDCARGVADAVEAPVSGVLNLGSGVETQLAQLAETIRECVGYKGKVLWDTTQPNGQPRRCVDGSRARAELGFSAEIGLERGIQETVAWFRNFAKHRMAA